MVHLARSFSSSSVGHLLHSFLSSPKVSILSQGRQHLCGSLGLLVVAPTAPTRSHCEVQGQGKNSPLKRSPGLALGDLVQGLALPSASLVTPFLGLSTPALLCLETEQPRAVYTEGPQVGKAKECPGSASGHQPSQLWLQPHDQGSDLPLPLRATSPSGQLGGFVSLCCVIAGHFQASWVPCFAGKRLD